MEDFFGTNIDLSELTEKAISLVMTYTPKLLLAILTLVVGLWLVNRFVNLLDHRLGKKDPTLNKFLCGLISAVLKVMLLISVASMIGIETTSFIAVVGAAGLAIGLALQGSLANFAGGVLILIFKPFRVGDTIEAEGYLGSVAEIQILYTVLNTFDNRRVVIPNGNLSNATLTNVSVYDKRRCDMTFGIGYDDDIDKAKKILQRLFEEDERSLTEPAPRICVGGLGDNSVDLMFRPWVGTDDLWPYYWDMQEKVKKAFDEEGISIPYPQRDVHLYNASND
ncbi:mechanosensitive ion channel family protein [Alteromonas mediterranea]|jgi:small conductance mechanosensitive channel|uniref:Small-conductance mechanosensitive channel n=3 Tax=Alteromonas TaxID=226 RepID=A0AAC8XK60_9ALTE|nr:mechanosensitive ion channel family protein [Alteromonas mediterranea]AGP94095.1 small-conductance mechanosensitive channel [Alteromonas mediterranea U8]MBR9782864.1 mechanosensitive ion channel family protein [Gammaproteobacteria bacterium]MEA3379405.1 mechanosensitive ion channel family protein [Pseudomonadota bacterium]AEA98149.1 mechanosensitive ion channel protein [Alteromonas mediterranea DE]AFV86001.1 small-conductance mechanosensitive channel [Alteromonas mediterranea DE1]|tara:strand:+ start:466 stop:1305 length:840 start_codon:yes stop_codon:yes gene_type:complete